MSEHLYAVIPAGGAGSRLWPRSRRRSPKHVLPLSGTGRVADSELERAVLRCYDLSPLGIIKELNLRRPLFRPMACYGHFGRTDVEAPWEDTRRAPELAAELG